MNGSAMSSLCRYFDCSLQNIGLCLGSGIITKIFRQAHHLSQLRFSTIAILLSSVLSDLTTRSISFLIDKCSRQTSAPTVEETLSKLQSLLRVHVIVEEADERHVSNHAMLRKLIELRKEMYRGYHTLDTFRCRGGHEQNRVSPSFTSSIFSPFKSIRFSSDGSSSEQDISEVLGCLEAAIRDTSELVVFLSGCPRRCRQPYNVYLILDHCMFGPQMEMDRIMEFLLQEEVPIDDGNPGVLPIVAPGKLGKSTLIEHACNHEIVRNHFSKIMCFRQCGTKDERTLATLSGCDVIKHRSGAIGHERILVIIELIGDMDEDLWRKFYSDCKKKVVGGSKIIVASRSDKIARFGTTHPLKVKQLTPEEYWYFFKVRLFGNTDPEDHPKLVSIAMDLARETNGNFYSASIFSSLLKANFDARFWSVALASVRRFKRINPLMYGEKRVDFWQGFEPIYVRRVNETSSEYLVILHDYETGFVQDMTQNEGPSMSVRDLLFGNNNVVTPRGRFQVVVWRSHIPPEYSYMWECQVQRPQRMINKRKRIQQIQQT